MSVWKKTESDIPPQRTPTPKPSAPPPRSEAPPRSRGVATIGPSISIKGDVSGEEDIVVEGRIEGKILLKSNNVTVGKNGRVKADVYANTITVEGGLEGDLRGKDEVIIRQSGQVRGNIQAPRVTLDSGCRFQGSIDMEQARQVQEQDQQAREAATSGTKPEKSGKDKPAAPLKPAVGASS